MSSAEQYPPTRHVHRDLRLAIEYCADGSGRGWLPVVPEILTASGSVQAGAIAVLVDVLAAGLTVRAVAPDWLATADLTLHLVGTGPVEPGVEIEATARMLRRGRTTVVATVDAYGHARALLATATMTFAVLPRRDGNPVVDTGPSSFPRVSLALDGSGLHSPLLDELGASVTDAATGSAELPLGDFVRNSLGALQGGVLATLACVSAEQAVGASAGSPRNTVDLQLTYLAPARHGPVRATAEVVATQSDWGWARVEVSDGDQGRLCAIARVTVASAIPVSA